MDAGYYKETRRALGGRHTAWRAKNAAAFQVEWVVNGRFDGEVDTGGRVMIFDGEIANATWNARWYTRGETPANEVKN